MLSSNEVAVRPWSQAYGIFTCFDGSKRVVAVNQDQTLNSPANPAAPGEIVTFYATGGGLTDPPSRTGDLAKPRFPDQPELPPFRQYPAPVAKLTAVIGGEPVRCAYIGLAPLATRTRG